MASPSTLRWPSKMNKRRRRFARPHFAGKRFLDVGSLNLSQLRVFFRIAIDTPEESKIAEANKAGQREAPAPPRGQQHVRQAAEHRWPSANLAAASNIAVASPRSLRREPQADRLGVGGKDRRFTHAQQKARAKQSAQVGRNRRRERRHAPQECADKSDAPHAELVQNHADRQLAESRTSS